MFKVEQEKVGFSPLLILPLDTQTQPGTTGRRLIQKQLGQSAAQIPAPGYIGSEIFTSGSQAPCLQNEESHRTHLLGIYKS